MDDKPEINQGFDRNVVFTRIKKKLTREYKQVSKHYKELDPTERYYSSRSNKDLNKLTYLLISMIQLRNGSRISEAVDAIYLLLNNEHLDEKVIVKIAKSKAVKYKRETGEKYITKTRYRKMTFPIGWIGESRLKSIKKHLTEITKVRLKKRVLDYLLKNFNCNTHSLRYSFINFMLYTKQKEIGLIAKIIGHSNLNQLVRYTQNIEADKIMDEDI